MKMGEEEGYYVYDRNPAISKCWNPFAKLVTETMLIGVISAFVFGCFLTTSSNNGSCSMLYDQATEKGKFDRCVLQRKNDSELGAFLLFVSEPLLVLYVARFFMVMIQLHLHFEAHPDERDSFEDKFYDAFCFRVPEAQRIWVREGEYAIVKDHNDDEKTRV